MCRPALFAPNFRLLLLVFTLHHLKRIQSFLSFNRYLITCSALATHCDHNSGLIYQVMEIRTQVFGQSKWITGFNCAALTTFRALLCPSQQLQLEATPTYIPLLIRQRQLPSSSFLPVNGIPIHIDEQMIKAPAASSV